MNIDVQIGESGQDDTSGTEPQKGEISVSQRFEDLEKRAKEVLESFQKLEKNFERLENRLDKASVFMTWMTGIMAGVFFVTSIMITLDYLKNNEERYEKFIDKTQEIRQDVYTKTEINSMLKEFKDCIWFNGLFRCLK